MSKLRDPYSALADRRRRTILEVLRDSRSRTAGEIAAVFPSVSRAAVSRHLKVLREARLVRARERGREWHYHLEARRLAEVEAWLRSFAPYWEESLRLLKERAEREP